MVVLSHFKGHAMGGFGGALKNISIGIGSTDGKTWIHTAGKTRNPAELWGNLPEQDDFTESMADACQAVVNHIGKETSSTPPKRMASESRNTRSSLSSDGPI